MNIEKIIIIDCFAPSIERQDILRRSIASLSKLNTHIMLVAHTAVPEDIIKSVNYYIYDSDNTFSDVYQNCFWWHSYPTFDIHVNIRPPFFPSKGHEFPIIRSMRNSLTLVQAWKYNKFCFVEFDNMFTSQDLEKINGLFVNLNPDTNKFFFFEGGTDDTNKYIETTFFGGYVSDFLTIFNLHFPTDIDSYNKIFSIKYPFNLERFFYEMMKSYSNHFTPIRSKNFVTYFDDIEKNLCHCNDGRAWILSDHLDGYYLILSNGNKYELNAEVKYGGKTLHKNRFASILYPALKLEQEGEYVIEYSFVENIITSRIIINFDLKNKLDYVNQGIITLKNK